MHIYILLFGMEIILLCFCSMSSTKKKLIAPRIHVAGMLIVCDIVVFRKSLLRNDNAKANKAVFARVYLFSKGVCTTFIA